MRTAHTVHAQGNGRLRASLGTSFLGLALVTLPCLGNAQTSQPATGGVTELVQAFKTAQWPWQQTEVAEKLVRAGDRSVIPQIEPFLTVENRHTRCNAGLVLAGLGDDRGFAAIFAELEDKSPNRPIGERQSDGRSPYPEGQIRNDRSWAVWVLGKLGDKRAVPILLEHIHEEDINDGIAYALGACGDARAIEPLKALLKALPGRRDNMRSCEISAGYSLAKLDDPMGVRTLGRVLKDTEWVVRRNAAEALGDCGDKAGIGPLIHTLADESPDVRLSAVRALGKLGDASTLPFLDKLRNDSAINTTGTPTEIRKAAREAMDAIERRHLPPR